MNSVSLTGKKWVLKKFNENEKSFIKDNFFLDDLTSTLLAIRKIKKENINTFLNPAIKNIMPNPYSLLDMDKTVKRTAEAIRLKDKIGVFGDYDVDGASSTALLGIYFDHIKQPYEIYIPDRKTEGYGPSIKGFNHLLDKGVSLIYTVDCGTLSYEPIDYLCKKKIDVIVLDHHQSEIKLPKAFSIVNPNRHDDKSKLNYLCAAGVSFMFLIALNKNLRESNWFKKNNVIEPDLINYLDLVALGTICDVVPLIDLNRAIVKQGLKVIGFKKNIGLKTLFDICKIENKPNCYHLGYQIGPRINAGGRVGKCSHGANLLLNKNFKEAFKLASELDMYNKERQLLEKKLLEDILNTVVNTKDPIIVLHGLKWHEGIIGIIASRIKEKFNKPTIVISSDKNIGKASARSIFGFDIGLEIINAVQQNILIKGGGHKMAGGFTIDIEKIDEFRNFIIKRFNSLNIDISSEKKIYIDKILAPSSINIDFYNKISLLAPFGSGNPEPKFTIEDLKPIKSSIVGEKHIKSLLIGRDGTTIKSIAFNATGSDLEAYLLKKDNKYINIVGKLTLNEWRGQKNVEFIIDDISVNKNDKNTVPSSIG